MQRALWGSEYVSDLMHSSKNVFSSLPRECVVLNFADGHMECKVIYSSYIQYHSVMVYIAHEIRTESMF